MVRRCGGTTAAGRAAANWGRSSEADEDRPGDVRCVLRHRAKRREVAVVVVARIWHLAAAAADRERARARDDAEAMMMVIMGCVCMCLIPERNQNGIGDACERERGDRKKARL